MTWHRSDLTAAGAGRALHFGHADHIPRWTLAWSRELAAYILGGDARHVSVAAADLDAWCARHGIAAPEIGELVWVREPIAKGGS